MKKLARMVAMAVALGAALMFSGCSTRTAKAPQSRAKPVMDFAVVESSTEKELTPAQLAELRAAVVNYLEEQGYRENQVYFVRVSFPAENPAEEPQWAVVRISNLPGRTYTVLAAYPGADDYYPYAYDFYRNGYYNPAFSGFSRWGYYDPFDYNYGGYTPRPVPPRDYVKPDKPGDKPNHPPGTRTRWDGTPRPQPDEPRGNVTPPRTPTRERWNRERPENADGSPRSYTPGNRGSGDRSHSPPPERTYSPPPVSNPPPAPVRSDPPPAVRDDSNRSTNENQLK
jgi:hypothetical protein